MTGVSEVMTVESLCPPTEWEHLTKVHSVAVAEQQRCCLSAPAGNVGCYNAASTLRFQLQDLTS